VVIILYAYVLLLAKGYLLSQTKQNRANHPPTVSTATKTQSFLCRITCNLQSL